MASVDTNLWPHASGAAAELVKAHEVKKPLTLYGGWFCPFVQRAWIVLEEKGIPYQYTEINPYHKAEEFLALNPRGLIPTLGCPVSASGEQQQPLYESLVICDYLEEAYPNSRGKKTSLYPSDPYEKARARLWIDHVNTRIVPSFYRFCQHQSSMQYSINEARLTFLDHLKTFARNADSSGPFFLGDKISMVDIALAPWLVRLWIFDHFKQGGLGLPEVDNGGQDEKIWERWRKWAKAVEEKRSVQDTSSSRQKYILAYQRYADDTTRSEVSKATRNGMQLP